MEKQNYSHVLEEGSCDSVSVPTEEVVEPFLDPINEPGLESSFGKSWPP